MGKINLGLDRRKQGSI